VNTRRAAVAGIAVAIGKKLDLDAARTTCP
jgi:hypothetical protein